MSLLVVLTGFAAGLWGITTLLAIVRDPNIEMAIYPLIIEAILVFLFLICRKKYKSPEYQAKMQRAKEARAAYEATAPERKQRNDELRAQRAELRRQATTVVSTRLIGDSAAEYKKSVGNMVVRGAVGSLFGPVGAAVGMATTKSKNKNKNKRRFLVKYEDGHIEEAEVRVGSIFYKHYMEKLEWED